jgi:regulatory protein
MAGGAARAYVAGLKMLARRELTEAQVRSRLGRRQFEPDDIDAAVVRLRQERALDDRRTALACARTEATLKHHGRIRALRQLQAIGVPQEVARAAVRDVFTELDEDALLQQALDRRLRHSAPIEALPVARRIHRYLLAQGFDAA